MSTPTEPDRPTPSLYLDDLLRTHLPTLVTEGHLVPVSTSPPDTDDPLIDFYTISDRGAFAIGSTHRRVSSDISLALSRAPCFAGRSPRPLCAALELLPRSGVHLMQHYPEWVARSLSTSHAFYYAPNLPGHLPFARGFNKATRHFHAGPPAPQGGTPLRSTRTSILEPLFTRLCLTDAARARLIAFLAGTLLRHYLVAMPGLFVASPGKGTGKSTLTTLAASVYTGKPPSECAGRAWHGKTELTKWLGGLPGSGPVIHIDNINVMMNHAVHNIHPGEFHSDDLAIGTSAAAIRVRVLGTAATAEIRRPVILCNSQQPKLSHDMADRFLFVLLDRPTLGGVTATQDARAWVDEHVDAVRAELAATLMDVQPLDDYAAGQDNKARHAAWFRHVLPVVARYGYDPADVRLQVDYPYTAPARNAIAAIQEAGLSGVPFIADDLLARSPHGQEWKALLNQLGYARSPGDAEGGTAARALETILHRLAESPLPFATDHARFRLHRDTTESGRFRWTLVAESWDAAHRAPPAPLQ